MAATNQPSRSEKSSIKYRCVPLEIASFKLADAGREDLHVLSDSHIQNRKHAEPKPVLSRAKFDSAVKGLWHSISQPSSKQEKDDYPDNLLIKTNEGNDELASPDDEYLCVDLKPTSFSYPTVNPEFERLKMIQKMLLFDPCTGHNNGSFFWRYARVIKSCLPVEPWRTTIGLGTVRFSCDLAKISEFASKYPSGYKDPIGVTQIEHEIKDSAENCSSESPESPAGILVAQSVEIKSHHPSQLSNYKDSSGYEGTRLIESRQESVGSLRSAYLLGESPNLDENNAVSGLSCSSLLLDYHAKFLASNNVVDGEGQLLSKSCCTLIGTSEDLSSSEEKDMYENCKQRFKGLALDEKPMTELCLPIDKKVKNSREKQGHALAGALAGIFVSLWLHPVDTIKTTLQARGTEQRSFRHMFGSIISERGVTGLYRGIGSNIASSAPISAVYTFTYESVKGALLPLLPKEYNSFAHCTAGGCASIATSFIFTPSERVKQQMQISSLYQNCWKALTGIIVKGGLSSLYAGWVAVLCRNVPHSIIKFYTYESLKQWMLSSQQSNEHLNTLQTLVCGGLAGSTAAIFTTPFDVVKTRFQTQIPGSLKQYDGVLHTIQEIAKHEGLEGLYRGLTPRLIMYMSQGALFFASYEFFKKVFSLEVQQLPARASKGRDAEDNIIEAV